MAKVIRYLNKTIAFREDVWFSLVIISERLRYGGDPSRLINQIAKEHLESLYGAPLGDRFLTYNQATKEFGVSKRTILRAIETGKLKRHGPPKGKGRVSRKELIKWISGKPTNLAKDVPNYDRPSNPINEIDL